MHQPTLSLPPSGISNKRSGIYSDYKPNAAHDLHHPAGVTQKTKNLLASLAIAYGAVIATMLLFCGALLLFVVIVFIGVFAHV
jgi:hypothetical protein